MSAATVRLRHTKLGKVRFASHRDIARVWERALRKAAVRVAYTEGFSPRPRLSFGLALPTGAESLGEYLDVDLDLTLTVDDLPARLTPVLPVGIDVQGAVDVAPGTPSLQQAVTSCTWRIEVLGCPPSRLDHLVGELLARAEVPVSRERKGRTVEDDLRPLILSLAVVDESGAVPSDERAVLLADLGTQPRGIRPAELLAALGSDLEPGRVCRIHQWLLLDGAPREPIPLANPGGWPGATSTPHAQARAS
jgi:radical SAM-linked protein